MAWASLWTSLARSRHLELVRRIMVCKPYARAAFSTQYLQRKPRWSLSRRRLSLATRASSHPVCVADTPRRLLDQAEPHGIYRNLCSRAGIQSHGARYAFALEAAIERAKAEGRWFSPPELAAVDQRSGSRKSRIDGNAHASSQVRQVLYVPSVRCIVQPIARCHHVCLTASPVRSCSR